jgi:PIN domain nuclease of toxin-antitoxin system
VRILIDTQTFLWWATTDPKLSATAVNIISDKTNEIVVSAAVSWEIAIKWQLGKLPIPIAPSLYIPSRMAQYGFVPLDITIAHTVRAESLPLHHKDPFDRILIAQCQIESVPIVTADPLIAQYGVSVLW